MKTRRYQLTKEAAAIVYRDQPWIFRDHLSSAANVFRDGDWLRLVDGANKVVGHGIYDAEGAIAIRIVRRGEARPDAAWLRDTLKRAIGKRAALAKRTTAVRLVHGESDHLPGVVVDRFGSTIVAQSYTRGADALARFAAIALANELKIPNVILRPAKRRKSEDQPTRVLRGSLPTNAPPTDAAPTESPTTPVERFTEDGITYAVDLASGQKSGTYLDLRGLRRAIATGFEKTAAYVEHAPPAKAAKETPALVGPDGATTRGTATDSAPKTKKRGDTRPAPRDATPARTAPRATTSGLDAPVAFRRVLNLFSYTGMLGRAAEQAGATDITQVDASERALAFAREHHVVDAAKHHFVCADIFQWLPTLAASESYDLVIVDPPAMTSNKQQVPGVLAGYKKLYRAAAPHVARGGLIVAACCTSRVERAEFRATVAATLGDSFERALDLAPEIDHPVAFSQGDYLKIEVWRRR